MFLKSVKVHWCRALRDSRRPKLNKLLHAFLPLALGALVMTIYQGSLDELGLMNAVAIITALLFSFVTLLIQLRNQLRTGEASAPKTRKNTLNLDYAFYSSVYLIWVGFALIVTLVSEQMLISFGPTTRRLYIFAGSALFAHFLMTMGIILKRLWRAYETFGLNRS